MIAQQGHTYVGGANVPLVVSNAKIADWLRANGFAGVMVVSKDNFPLADLPPIPVGTEADWDTVAVATRVAPTADIKIPSRVRWIVDVTPMAVPVPGQAPAPVPVPVPVVPSPSAPVPAPTVASWPAGEAVLAGSLLGVLAAGVAIVWGLP